MSDSPFTLTTDHIKLVQHFYIDWDDQAYDGAPYVNIKRPYGNSGNQAYEVYRVLKGKDWDEEKKGEMGDDKQDKYMNLHRETATALQIILCTGSFVPGVYFRAREYAARSWTLDSPASEA